MDIKIIGPTAGNNTDLHHGILFLYYILPPLTLFNGSAIAAIVWNLFFNALAAVVLFFFAKSLFKNFWSGIVSAILWAGSYYGVEYSSWISNPSPTLLTVPVCFWGMWEYLNGKRWGVYAAAFFLGLSIQFELFFIYLIPFVLMFFFLSKARSIKDFLLSTIFFSVSASTMILTEMKYKFSGVKYILGLVTGSSGRDFAGEVGLFTDRFFETYAQSIFPSPLGQLLGLIVFIFFAYLLFREKKHKKALIFMAVYLLSPFFMLLLGYHGAPWFLIALPPAMTLLTAFLLSRVFKIVAVVALIVILTVNLNSLKKDKADKVSILEPDESAFLSSQLGVVDYTYASSGGSPFTVNSVTNPLYVNAVWSYHYKWYGESKYGHLPSWSGGDQLHPYDFLPKAGGDEKFLYLVIDKTPRIPEVHKILARNWANERSILIEIKDFGGIEVEKRKLR